MALVAAMAMAAMVASCRWSRITLYAAGSGLQGDEVCCRGYGYGYARALSCGLLMVTYGHGQGHSDSYGHRHSHSHWRVYACGSGVLRRSSFLKSLRRVFQAGCSDGMAIA